MDPTHFGAEQVTEEDRGYRGSRFSEVRDALFANPYQRVWGGPGQPPLPIYDVTLLGVLLLRLVNRNTCLSLPAASILLSALNTGANVASRGRH